MKLYFFILCFLLSHYTFSQGSSNKSTTTKLVPFSVTLTKNSGVLIDQSIDDSKIKESHLIISISENDMLQPKLIKSELININSLRVNKNFLTNEGNLETELKIINKFVIPTNENTSKNNTSNN